MTALSKKDLIHHITTTFAEELAEVEIEEYFRMYMIKVIGVLKPGVVESAELRKRIEQELDANTLPNIRAEVVLLGK